MCAKFQLDLIKFDESAAIQIRLVFSLGHPVHQSEIIRIFAVH